MKPVESKHRPLTRERRRKVLHMGPMHKRLIMIDLAAGLQEIAEEKGDTQIVNRLRDFAPWIIGGALHGIKPAMLMLLDYYDKVVREYYNADLEDLIT